MPLICQYVIVSINSYLSGTEHQLMHGVCCDRAHIYIQGGCVAGELSTESSVIDSKTPKSLDDEYIGIIIGALAALSLVLFAVILVIILRHRRRKYNNNHRAMKSI